MSNQASDPIKDRIAAIKAQKNVYEVGRVTRMRNYIVDISGMENVGYFELVNISDKASGYVSKIGRDSVTVELVRVREPVHVGDEAVASGRIFGAFHSASSMGQVVDMFAVDKLTGRMFKDRQPIGVIPPPIPIMDRTAVNRPMYTGLSAIDMMYPIGRGQRQLIIGDKKTGKTQLGLDAIANQRGQDVICIYIALGKTKKTVKEVYAELQKRGAMEYTIMLAAFQDDGAPVLYMTPMAGVNIAHEYMLRGADVLVVIDDLTLHANTYREISLLAGKIPGRDAYPADVFYLHASLLEQGCQHKSGGSITILPIVETRGGEITDYISTNIISITDGQLVLSAKAFEKGQKPAVDFGLSVSRLGGAVQIPELRKTGASVRRELLSYLETREVFELVNMEEMNEEMRSKMTRGRKLLDLMGQYKFSPISPDGMTERFAEFTEAETEGRRL